MNEPGPALDEVVPWSRRTARRLRTGWVGIRSWVSGWGIGGVFLAGLGILVAGYLALATFGSDHVATTPCHQAAPLVDQLQTMQFDKHDARLDPSRVRDLHRIGSQLRPVADDAYGSLADILKSLAATASDARVGEHLHAGDALNQESQLCDGGR